MGSSLSSADNVRDRLRAATHAQHAEVDASFPQGLRDLADYARYLRGMHRFAVDFEIAVGAPARQSVWLARDLATNDLAPLPVLVAQTRVGADEGLGWSYVMAGSSLGARHLAKGVRGLGQTPERGACFLARHSGGADWRDMQAQLAALDVDDAPRVDRMVRGARDAFHHVAACLAGGVTFQSLAKESAA